jgi:hypothetical protein
MAELIDRALTDQALIHPAELPGHCAELGSRDRSFVHPGCLLFQAVDHKEYRALIVAVGGPSGRCHLVTTIRLGER